MSNPVNVASSTAGISRHGNSSGKVSSSRIWIVFAVMIRAELLLLEVPALAGGKTKSAPWKPAQALGTR